MELQNKLLFLWFLGSRYGKPVTCLTVARFQKMDVPTWNENDAQDPLKIAIVGGGGVGKSMITLQFVKRLFKLVIFLFLS
jgi:pantothenate kinase-related protein Tda10